MERKITNHTFTVNKNLISLLIKNQGGSFKGAVFELIMNSIDAGATKVDINLYRKRKDTGVTEEFDIHDIEWHKYTYESKAKKYDFIITIKDDGKGFASKEQVIAYFGDFGNPHTDGDSTFGKFRMGRGQIFNYGRCNWRSGTLDIFVDIDSDIQSYSVEENLPHQDGCEMSCAFYDNVLNEISALSYMSSEYSYLATDLFISGVKRSENPKHIEWEFENEYFYFKENEYRSLEIYNQGIAVNSRSVRQDGMQGILLSKIPLELNTARNQIIESRCDVWRSFTEFYRDREQKKLGSDEILKQDIPSYDIAQYALKLVDGTISLTRFLSLKMIHQKHGRTEPLYQIFNQQIDYIVADSANHAHSAMFDKLDQIHSIMVLSNDMKHIERWGNESKTFKTFIDVVQYVCNQVESNIGKDKQLQKLFREKLDYGYSVQEEVKERLAKIYKNVFRHFSNATPLINQYDVKKEILEKSVLKGKEIILFDAVSFANNFVARKMKLNKRKLYLGNSYNTANAWTDGSSFIALDIELLRSATDSINTLEKIINTLFHEYTHADHNEVTHEHTIDFYKKYHDVQFFNIDHMSVYGITNTLANKLITKYEQAGIKLPHEFVPIRYGKMSEKVTQTNQRIKRMSIIKKNQDLIPSIRGLALQKESITVEFMIKDSKVFPNLLRYAASSIRLAECEYQDFLNLYMYYREMRFDLLGLNFTESKITDCIVIDENNISLYKNSSYILWKIRKDIEKIIKNSSVTLPKSFTDIATFCEEVFKIEFEKISEEFDEMHVLEESITKDLIKNLVVLTVSESSKF